MADAALGRVIGRYALFDALAAGGMATVHIGRLLGPVGFARTVAIKRLHPQFSRDPEFVSMFLDEARLCARIRHPNVVPTLDVVAAQGELFLVMDYVQGESLAQLVKSARARGEHIPWRVSVAIVAGTLHGLHAAHESKDERGVALGLVHRDVSPQNVLVGTDGMARVVDFGIAKAAGRAQTTREGAVKGKLGYMAPEQMAAEGVTRQADVYAAAVMLWELLTSKRLFDGETEAITLAKVLTSDVPVPSTLNPEIPPELDDVVMKGVNRQTSKRYASAREMALALEKVGCAGLGEVAEWLESVAAGTLAARQAMLSIVEKGEGLLTPIEIAEGEHRSPSEMTIEPSVTGEHSASSAEQPPARKPNKLMAYLGAAAIVGVGAVVLWIAIGSDASSRGDAAAAQPSAAPVIVAPTASAAPSASAAAQPTSSTEVFDFDDEPTAEPSASASAAPATTHKGPMPRPTASGKSPFKGLGGRE